VSHGRALAAAAGVALIGWLIWEIGPATLGAAFTELSWRTPICLLPYALVALLDAVGWRYAFPERMPPVAVLVAARLAGEAVNLTTPSATLGGEPLKAWLLARAHLPFLEGLASVVIAKTALVAAQLAFLIVALALATWQAMVAPALLGGIAALTAAGVVAVAGFVMAQRRGLFGASGRMLAWLGVTADRLAPHLAQLDVTLARFYRERPARFALAVVFHLLGWIAGAVEIWVAFRLLGTPLPLSAALVVEAFTTAIRSASFLVPAALGVQESGLVGIVASFGLDARVGLTFGLIRRLREAAWAAVGFGILASWRRAARPSRPATPEPLP
jgi:putative membrane protein